MAPKRTRKKYIPSRWYSVAVNKYAQPKTKLTHRQLSQASRPPRDAQKDVNTELLGYVLMRCAYFKSCEDD